MFALRDAEEAGLRLMDFCERWAAPEAAFYERRAARRALVTFWDEKALGCVDGCIWVIRDGDGPDITIQLAHAISAQLSEDEAWQLIELLGQALGAAAS